MDGHPRFTGQWKEGRVGGWGAIQVSLTLVVPQVSREQGRAQRALDVVEEGLLLLRGDGVDAAEGQADEAVVVGVLGELGGDLGGGLDGLALELDAADVDDVGVDVARGAAAVAVLDAPGGARELLGRGALGRGIDAVARLLALGQLAAEDPQVRRARVEVEVERLRRRAHGHRRQVLRVLRLGRRLGAALLLLPPPHRHRAAEPLGQRLAELAVRPGQRHRAVLHEARVAHLVHGEAGAPLPVLLQGRRGRADREGHRGQE